MSPFNLNGERVSWHQLCDYDVRYDSDDPDDELFCDSCSDPFPRRELNDEFECRTCTHHQEAPCPPAR